LEVNKTFSAASESDDILSWIGWMDSDDEFQAYDAADGKACLPSLVLTGII